jgi:Tfp pilus assembly protein FimT
LVELMVVVAVIAVLAGMTLPRLWGGAARWRLRGSAQRLMAAARYAHDFAATRRCQARLIIQAEQGLYVVAAPTGQDGEYVPLTGGPGRQESLGEGLGFGRVLVEPCAAPLDEADEGLLMVRFLPTGEADAAVLEVRNDKHVYSVIILPAGGRVELAADEVTELPESRVDLDV